MKHKLKYILLFTILYLLTTGCAKKAETDKEIRKMIVGTWIHKYQGKQLAIVGGKNKVKVIEFNDEGKFRYILETTTPKKHINNADTANYDERSYSIFLTFEDSIFYEINDSKLSFYKKDSIIDGRVAGFATDVIDLDIVSLSERKLIIDNSYDEQKYFKN